MLISPLVRHAAMHLPALTDYFSDKLDVSTLDVVEGGACLITCAVPHGIAIGDFVGICITDVEIPNRVISVVDVDGNALLTLEHDHDISGASPNGYWEQETTAVRLSGFVDLALNGQLALLDVPANNQLLVKPLAALGGQPLTGAEKLFERLEGEIIGWHKVGAISDVVLEFVTPVGVARSYQVVAPKISYHNRLFGSVYFDAAKAGHIRADGNFGEEKSGLYICLPPSTSVSKSRRARSAAVSEINSGMDYRATLLDGIEVYAFCPAAGKGQAELADLCQGEIFTAVMRTFFGLKLPRPELAADISEHHMMGLVGHRGISYDGAYYIHRYEFEAPATITNGDAISADQYPDLAPGGDSLLPVGSRSFRGVDFDEMLADGGEALTANVDF